MKSLSGLSISPKFPGVILFKVRFPLLSALVLAMLPAVRAAAIVEPPVLSIPSGVYATAQSVSISAASGAAIYYTTNGTAPTALSTRYTGPIPVSSSESLEAIAIAGGTPSAIAAAIYTIAATTPEDVVNYSKGFLGSKGPVQFNGSTDLHGSRLQLTKGGQYEAGSAFYATPVTIDQPFTSNFTFELSSPNASVPLSKISDGITFTILSAEPYIVPDGATALGGDGGDLGFAGIMNNSGAGYNDFDLAVKFDLFSNSGEGPNSTGLYINGALPTTPAIDLTGSGIDLHSGHAIFAQIAYDGSNLSLILTDTVTFARWSRSFPIDVPKTIGSVIAYVGFTGGTGATTANQEILSWTYVSGATSPAGPPPVAPPLPDYPAGFNPVGLATNGSAALSGTALRLTNGGRYEAGSAFYATPVTIDQSFSTDFTFQLSAPPSVPLASIADGFTFTILSAEPYDVLAGPYALGNDGGSLGFAGIVNGGPNYDMAIKFDLYNNSGEGPNSTGLYMNGAAPTMPSINLMGSGIDLHSGHPFKAHIAYAWDESDFAASVLTLTLTDTVTLATWSYPFTINIPQTIGSVIGFVGFTGGSGGGSAVQDILNWKVTTP